MKTEIVVAEGNRRVCAAQLLTDPQKAPESARARFKALAAKARDVSRFNVAEFRLLLCDLWNWGPPLPEKAYQKLRAHPERG
jgi:hypothetical protein